MSRDIPNTLNTGGELEQPRPPLHLSPGGPPAGSTFSFIQREVDVGLPLRAVGEAVEGEQVAFPVAALKVESPAERPGKPLRDDPAINSENM